eukprot:gnl/TRDRNA2_/TRDRNA2_201741_c0_seq1.p1 gnl/TRDRNA2_/TRDRNA2_201741_c0~~gnl/TRDRNA2_/TRDRNA2_201741_c0_seq1.p1  ORF type:complete len:520 (+),score=149.64 gnl/TRDRNA2_/TRDRNA2_201741_c0_seq1:117-1676(+)
MGCGGSVAAAKLSAELKESESELAAARSQLQDKEKQLGRVQEHHKELVSKLHGENAAAQDGRSLQDQVASLRADLAEQRAKHEEELEREREHLKLQHSDELNALKEEREAVDLRTELAAAEKSHQELVKTMEESARAEAAKFQEEAEQAEQEIAKLRPQLSELLEEQERVAAESQRIKSEYAEMKASGRGSSDLERRLAEARDEHARTEQRHEDLEAHHSGQVKALRGELMVHTEALRQRDAALRERDRELAEVNGQLTDLQSLFDEVNQQLQKECARIERLQETVALCAKQSKELEALQGMLEESHKMLSQVRDALEQERAERIKTSRLLEHEQMRTQLLLDVLKHFKEKLQGLTPQVLLSRLGVSDSKALLADGQFASLVGSGLPAELSATQPASGLLEKPYRGGVTENGSHLPSFTSPRGDEVASTAAPLDTPSMHAWAPGTASYASISGAPSPSVGNFSPLPEAKRVPGLPVSSNGLRLTSEAMSGGGPQTLPWGGLGPPVSAANSATHRLLDSE